MRKRAFLVALMLAAAGGAIALPPAAPAAAAADWTRTVVATPEGGFRMGNPGAKVKLVEYASLTCPHCAHFSADSKGQLAAYVRSGKVSYEFRNYVLNGVDVMATLLARCAGPSGFFGMAETLYAAQPQWVGRISGVSEAQKAQLKPLSEAQRLGRLADIGGLTQIAARYGVPAARAKQCLADNAGRARLDSLKQAAQNVGVIRTPTFFVNGTMLYGNEWPDVDAALRQAGG